MLVTCVKNRIGQLDPASIGYNESKECTNDENDPWHVTPGKTYVVYALKINNNNPWCFIADDLYDGNVVNYPVPHPWSFFEVINSGVSTCWHVDCVQNDSKTVVWLSFREWVENENFYEDLVNACPHSTQIFQKYKTLIDQEFLI